jgi:hypothetical protein
MDINSLSIQKISQPKTCRDYLKVYHPNIRSIRRKTCELLSHLYPDLPHVLCLTEHHLNKMGMNHVYIDNYDIGAQFCRAVREKGVVVMYVYSNLKFSNIDLSKHCKEKDFEICAVKLNLSSSTVCTVTIFRSSFGNFNYFLQSLDNVLQSLYTHAFHIIIFGDIKINCVVESEQKIQLDNLLLMYYLTGIEDFPLRIIHTATAIDNIFIDIAHLEDYLLIPFSNDLSGHYAHILMIKISFQIQSDRLKVDKFTIIDLMYKLSNESWDSIFHGNDSFGHTASFYFPYIGKIPRMWK